MMEVNKMKKKLRKDEYVCPFCGQIQRHKSYHNIGLLTTCQYCKNQYIIQWVGKKK